MMKDAGIRVPTTRPRSSIAAWLSKVHTGPNRGAPKTGGVPFFWNFDEGMDVEETASDIVSVFRAVALPLFDETLTPEAARAYHAAHPDRLQFPYDDHPELAAFLGDWDTVKRWHLGPSNPAMARVLSEWAKNGLPDTSGDIPYLAVGATLDGAPNPFPPAPPSRGRATKRA
jgi:hypothetical protein